MSKGLSVVIITKNAAETLSQCLDSIVGLSDETILVDDFSTDSTTTIAKKHNVMVLQHHEINLGKQKQYAIKKATKDWILVLDADEYVSTGLKHEIKKIISKKTAFSAYRIPYENHYLGKIVKWGGENYAMIRLVKKTNAHIADSLVHESIDAENLKVGKLTNCILHYSYRSLGQMYRKFTDYAIREAKERRSKGESASLLNIISYPAHMFFARFIKDKGYKDGFFRIPLDLGFAYMEFLVQSYLFFT